MVQNLSYAEHVSSCERALENADADLALQHANRVFDLAKTLESRCEGLLLKAMALAMLDCLEDSLALLQKILRDRPNDVVGYYAGSLLANLNRYTEANQFFTRNLVVPLGNGAVTSTACLRFDSINADSSELPFKRQLDSDFDVPVDCDSVYLVCGDSTYYRIFRDRLLTSLEEYAPEDCVLHIHIVNPAGDDMAWQPHPSKVSVRLTSEEVHFPALNVRERKTYFSCVRYMILPHLLDIYDVPMLVADFDQLLVASPSPVFELLQAADVALLKFPQSKFNLLSQVSATIAGFSGSSQAKIFARQLVEYLVSRMALGKCFEWHLDQAALAVTSLTADDTNIGAIPEEYMCSTGDGDANYPPETIFWSVTYSIAANARKLSSSNDESMPLVSIVMPVYNGANYMIEAIDSALSQVGANVEVIVVNDGSNDGGETTRIAESYGERIRYFEQPNGGVASALNRGIREMRGEVFCWLSHDDIQFPEKTAQQVARWISEGRPDCIYYSNYRLIDEKGETITDVILDHQMLVEKPVYALLRGSIHGCSVFVPRVLLDKHGFFDVELPTTQDYDLWRRMIGQVPFVHMDSILIGSRWHDEQGSKTMHHRDESNELWRDLLCLLNEQEQTKLEGSAYRFFKAMAAFLHQNGLDVAGDHAAEESEQALSDSLVSVVIPNRSRVDVLVTAINSVLAQTHPAIEVVVVDECSEQQRALIESLANRHERRSIKVISHPTDNLAVARNLGCSCATGDYIAFLDSDTLFLPDKIERQLRFLEDTRGSACHTSYWGYDRDGNALKRVASAGIEPNPFPLAALNYQIATSTVMVDREMWLDQFGFPENTRIDEDVVVWLRMTSQSMLSGLDEPLAVIRSDEGCDLDYLKNQSLGLRNAILGVRDDPYMARHVGEIVALAQHSAKKIESVADAN